MNIKTPYYTTQFQCIGGACEDSCCIGWDVDIDKGTYEKYRATQNVQLNKAFKKYVYKNPDPADVSIDYAKIELTEDKRCQFLNSDNWCIIQKHLGESYLSNVCKSFPRIYHRINGEVMMTLNTSCPEAARLLLNLDHSMDWVNIKENDFPPIITFDVKTSDKNFKGTTVQYLTEVQAIVYKILNGTVDELDTKLINTGIYLNGVLKNMSPEYVHQNENHAHKKILGLEHSFFEAMRSFLTDQTIMSDLEYLKWHEKLNAKSSVLISDAHKALLVKYYENLMVKNLFPFTEGGDIWEAYLLLLARHCVLKTEFAKVAIDDAALYLQAFTKAFDHNRSLPELTIQWMKKNKTYHPVHLFLTEK